MASPSDAPQQPRSRRWRFRYGRHASGPSRRSPDPDHRSSSGALSEPFGNRPGDMTAMREHSGLFGADMREMNLVSYRTGELSPLSAWLTEREKKEYPMIRSWFIRSCGENVDDMESFLKVEGSDICTLQMGALQNRKPDELLTLDNFLTDLDWSSCPNLTDSHLEVSLPPASLRRIHMLHSSTLQTDNIIEIDEAPFIARLSFGQRPVALRKVHLVLYNEADLDKMLPAGRLPHVPSFANALVQIGGLYCQYTVSFPEMLKGETATYMAKWYNTMLYDEMKSLRDIVRGEVGWSWNRKAGASDYQANKRRSNEFGAGRGGIQQLEGVGRPSSVRNGTPIANAGDHRL